MDTKIKALTNTIKDQIERHVPWKRPTKYSTPEWSTECNQAIYEAREAEHLYHSHPTAENQQAYCEAKRVKKRLKRARKSMAWRKGITKAIVEGGMWKLAKWARTKGLIKPPRTPPGPHTRKGRSKGCHKPTKGADAKGTTLPEPAECRPVGY